MLLLLPKGTLLYSSASAVGESTESAAKGLDRAFKGAREHKGMKKQNQTTLCA
jgi:hypothetical protein